MKILVIQLARLGDIYQTWPTLSALRREYENAEINLLVRERFSAAASNCPHIDKLIKLPTSEILTGVISYSDDSASLKKLSEFSQLLKDEKYDKIINLSFSPFSSYLVSSITHDQESVSGYTRFNDGYLCIPDDVSAYFYAQVGVDKENRIHLSQIFSGVAGVDLLPEDWTLDFNESFLIEARNKFKLDKNFIVIQVGASQSEKTYGEEKWSQVINHFRKINPTQIVLVGAKEETELVKKVCMLAYGAKIVNLCGKTNLTELASLVKMAELVVAGDSLLLHIASLTNTKTLNVSFSSVNFWETGPLAPKSRIVYGETRYDIASDRVATEMDCMLGDKNSGNVIIPRISYGPVAYEFLDNKNKNFSWQLIEAIYMQGSYPLVEDADIAHGLQRLNEVAHLALQQLTEIDFSKNVDIQMELLSQVDTMLEIIPKLVPPLRPLLSWFQTERVRIGPSSLEHVLSITKSIFMDLKSITDLYIESDPLSGVEDANANVFT
ncbi:MAG: glycosyltransferase family 9 protein [Bdellovibrionales bacterium]|nr:glycosyltransferase family 9 protein [Bdellovibrionales bacterium]